jgi:hypothetical protein
VYLDAAARYALGVPTHEEMLELVQAHAALDEPMETAIWIRRDDREAWLVELLPSIEVDAHPERPVTFNPGRFFRHPLKLIASNIDGLRRALEQDHGLARDIAAGEILHGPERGRELQELARSAHGHAQAG